MMGIANFFAKKDWIPNQMGMFKKRVDTHPTIWW
jgi:hypothetical protein